MQSYTCTYMHIYMYIIISIILYIYIIIYQWIIWILSMHHGLSTQTFLVPARFAARSSRGQFMEESCGVEKAHFWVTGWVVYPLANVDITMENHHL